ncbi:Pentatricopeptide repeat-containing protein [Forsythia ovata]|uniref:Pentatricopeptide repeat-containing protein n=1 Tax=Forsythia ovata TaxID=205694 RepID=A0ABD1P5P9_9LAMI
MATKKICSLIPFRGYFLQFTLLHSASSSRLLEESIRAAIEAKTYEQIPDLLSAVKDSCINPNPFSFLSKFPENHRAHIIDDILQSFTCTRPRSRPRITYSCLLSYTLESPNPLPLALAILQRTLRSGCLPVPQTYLLLSNAWIKRRKRPESISSILQEMLSIGYSLDCGTCNYLILSLCKVDQMNEAVKVLKGMCRAGCIPNLDSYGTIIGELSECRMINEVAEMVKEMVSTQGLFPRQEIVVKALAAMLANRDIWRAVEMIEFLESEDVHIGFEGYELVLEGCLECRQFVLAGKFVMQMTERGFIPYIRLRQKLVEGLVSVGESELASVVRQRFLQLKS